MSEIQAYLRYGCIWYPRHYLTGSALACPMACNFFIFCLNAYQEISSLVETDHLFTVAILAQGTTSGQCDSQGLFFVMRWWRWDSCLITSRTIWRTIFVIINLQLMAGVPIFLFFATRVPRNFIPCGNWPSGHRSHFGSRYHIWSMRLARPFFCYDGWI